LGAAEMRPVLKRVIPLVGILLVLVILLRAVL
jgi:hypothetical protein